jgi:hypothetical protein
MANNSATLPMPSVNRLKLQVELISWLITAIIVYLVVSPIMHTFSNFEYLYVNILFVGVFVTYTRYIFMLKYTFLGDWQKAKIFFIFLSIPLVFYLIQFVQGFEEFVGDEGLRNFEQYFTSDTTYEEQHAALTYMRREMMFFGTSAVIVAILLPFRLLISFWRVYNNTGRV